MADCTCNNFPASLGNVTFGANVGIAPAIPPNTRLAVALSTSNTAGDNFCVDVDATQQAAAVNTLRGIDVNSFFSGTSGVQTGLNGVDATLRVVGSGGTVQYARGFSAWAVVSQGASVSDLRLIHVVNPTNSGTLSNLYGVYIGTMSAGATNYALYAEGGRSYFGGDVGIGVPIPESKLQVNGNVAIGFGTTPTGAHTNGLGVAGNVGIGTTGPAVPGCRLEVVGGSVRVGGREVINAQGQALYA